MELSMIRYEAKMQFPVGSHRNPRGLDPVEALYEYLYNGHPVVFDLEEGKRKVRFQCDMGVYSTRPSMTRRLIFK